MKEGQHVNFGPIQAIFVELSWSQPKLAHSCHGRGQRSNGAINRNKHFFRSFCRAVAYRGGGEGGGAWPPGASLGGGAGPACRGEF